MHWLWVTLGLLSLGLAVVGIVVPLLPTVPLLILAAFFFARSSERLHTWLINHRLFGPPIRDWQRSGAISTYGKRWATFSIVIVFTISVALGLASLILGVQAVVLMLTLGFIWSRPSG